MRNFVDLYGDLIRIERSDGTVVTCQERISLDNIQRWLERERPNAIGRGEREDLDLALKELIATKKAIEENNALKAANHGMHLIKYVARYETRPRRKGHSKGGKTRRKLSDEQHKDAMESIANKVQNTMSARGACRRVATDLNQKHGVTISSKTLEGYWREEKKQWLNA